MSVTGDFAKLRALRLRLSRTSTSDFRERLARVVGEAARTELALGFRNSIDPYGTPWAPLKRRKGKPLLDTGRLRSSFTYHASASGLRVGSNVVYAKFHQYGTGGRKQAGGRSQAVRGNRFVSNAAAGRQRRGAVSFRRLNYAAGSGKIPARLMLPTSDRGLGNWEAPMRAAAKRFVARSLKAP